MEDSEKDFLDMFWGCLKWAAAIVFLVILWNSFCGCKILQSKKSNTNSKDSIVNNSQGSVRVDSSGSKSDKTNTKETVYYPQPIYIQGKDGETKVISVPQYIKETGTEKTEQAQVITDTTWKNEMRELRTLIQNTNSTTKGSLLNSPIIWILIGVVGLLLLKNFLPFKITRI